MYEWTGKCRSCKGLDMPATITREGRKLFASAYRALELVFILSVLALVLKFIIRDSSFLYMYLKHANLPQGTPSNLSFPLVYDLFCSKSKLVLVSLKKHEKHILRSPQELY